MEQSVAFIIVSTAVRVISAGRPLSFCKKTVKVYDALALTVHITLLGIVIVGLRRHEWQGVPWDRAHLGFVRQSFFYSSR